ncbi:hypothetical protein [Streptosporangium sp. NPDC000396]|uniref:hypothetical protein n=1 Tax=Streptosporangium sp. NPDC000396 TaxID=3366185 RepID=UPI0036B08010
MGRNMSWASGGTRTRALGMVAVGCLASALLGTTTASAETETAGARRAGAGSSPDTCASGYVWRGARASDHVCVTPATRDRTAGENAGVWHECTTGFVWREAYPGDHRCVVPDSRSQARSDNANAPYRLAWVIMTRRNHSAPPPTCEGNACSHSNESPYQTVGMRGYYLTPGAQVTVRIVRSADGRVMWSGNTTAQAGGKGPGGNYSIDTERTVCQGGLFAPPLDAYVQARENGGAWSPRVPIAWRLCSRL